MKKVLIATLASGWYRNFAPIFLYTAKKANPDCDVKVFFKEDVFPEHDDSSCGLLRFCVPNEYFKGYDFVYFTDVDFIMLPHRVSVVKYHIDNITATGSGYSGYLGPQRARWYGNNCRLAGGSFMATRRWLELTSRKRAVFAADNIDGIEYREKDEVYLQRMTKSAGFNIPNKEGCFCNGKQFDRKYRDIHLGDFKEGFGRRWRNVKKMRKKFLTDNNVKRYLRLLDDEKFLSIVGEARKNSHINSIFNNLKTHLDVRGACLDS